MPSEFELIRRYFTHPAPHTRLGVGDDAALVRVARGMELAVKQGFDVWVLTLPAGLDPAYAPDDFV